MREIPAIASMSCAVAAGARWLPWDSSGTGPAWLVAPFALMALAFAICAYAPSLRRWTVTGIACAVVLGVLVIMEWLCVLWPRSWDLGFWLILVATHTAAAFSVYMTSRADQLTAPIPIARART